jgi:Uma2 family endonuclease
MKTVVLGAMPPELAFLIAERQRLGLDHRDEVWEGDYHMNPAPGGQHSRIGSRLAALFERIAAPRGLTPYLEFNLGTPTDYRVPDLGILRAPFDGAWAETAAVVVEIRSPGDETYEKFNFYAARGVEEILVIDPQLCSVHWFACVDRAFEAADRSAVLGIDVTAVRAAIGFTD